MTPAATDPWLMRPFNFMFMLLIGQPNVLWPYVQDTWNYYSMVSELFNLKLNYFSQFMRSNLFSKSTTSATIIP